MGLIAIACGLIVALVPLLVSQWLVLNIWNPLLVSLN